jgi:hypothetical protein
MNNNIFYLIFTITTAFPGTMQKQKKHLIKPQKQEGLEYEKQKKKEPHAKTSTWRRFYKKMTSKRFSYSMAGGIIGGSLFYSVFKKYKNINSPTIKLSEKELDSYDKYNYGLLEGDFSGNISTEEEAEVLGDYIRKNPDKIALLATLAVAPASLAATLPARFKYFRFALKSLFPNIILSRFINPLINNLPYNKSYTEGLKEEFLKDRSKTDMLKESAKALEITYAFGKVFQGLGYLKGIIKPKHIIQAATLVSSNIAAASAVSQMLKDSTSNELNTDNFFDKSFS